MTLAVALVVQSPFALACSAFRMPVSESQVMVGRNFDWDYGHGLMVINKRGVSKKALSLHPSDQASWTSKFGSLTFNQAGRELPYGGLNEKGLMIEVLWLGYTSWPETTAPSINEVQWIQYQLDTKDSVADLIAHIDDVRIVSVFAKVHFFVCDASGECATIEGMGSKIVIHSGASMPVAALTNDPYETSLKYGQSLSCSSLPAGSQSLYRYARAACASTVEIEGEPAADEASRVNTTLDAVSQGDYTKWSIVYNLTEKSISIRTKDSPVAKSVRLSQFDFSCATPVKILDMNTVVATPTDVSSQFVDYTRDANKAIVEASLLNGFAHLPKPVVDNVVMFPESMACSAP
jgi:penicillin V acylase-like amidase (Ntn superfamily)